MELSTYLFLSVIWEVKIRGHPGTEETVQDSGSDGHEILHLSSSLTNCVIFGRLFPLVVVSFQHVESGTNNAYVVALL